MDVVVQGPQGPMGGYFRRSEGQRPGVLLFPDAFGLRPATRELADRFAAAGYHVAVPDPFWRDPPRPAFDPARVFGGDPDERARLMGVLERLPDDLLLADTESWLGWLEAQPDVICPLGMVGYCLGGGLAVHAACRFPDRLGAVASIHGGRFLVAPGTPDRLAAELRVPTYVGVAAIDRSHDAAVSAALDAACRAAGVAYAIELYEGASHGFALRDLSVFSPEAAERHLAAVIEWFGRHLGKEVR